MCPESNGGGSCRSGGPEDGAGRGGSTLPLTKESSVLPKRTGGVHGYTLSGLSSWVHGPSFSFPGEVGFTTVGEGTDESEQVVVPGVTTCGRRPTRVPTDAGRPDRGRG